MGNKSFLNRITDFIYRNEKSLDQSDALRALQGQLDELLEKEVDFKNYNIKVLESEPSASNLGYPADFTGIDQQIDTAALQRVYSTETWLYIAVNAIARTIGGLPLLIKKKKKMPKQVINEITGEISQLEQEFWETAAPNKLSKLFQRPNKLTNKTEFLWLIVVDLLTTGNAFVHLKAKKDLSAIESDPTDDEETSPFGQLRTLLAGESPVDEMYRISPSLIKPIPTTDRLSIEGYILQSSGGVFAFAPAEIIHIKLPNPLDPFMGLPPLIPAFKPVLLDRYSTENMIRFYKSGARLGGVIKVDKNLNNQQILTISKTFDQLYTGRANHHRTAVLPNGMEYQQLEQNPAETALLEFCKYNKEAILSTYGVPPIKAGVLENANYANAKAQLETFFTDTIIPYLSLLEDAFTGHAALFPDNKSLKLVFDLSEVKALQEDNMQQAQTAKEMLAAGLKVDEVRHKIWKLGPVEGGDQVLAIVKAEKKQQDAFDLFPAKSLKVEAKEALPPDSQSDTALVSDITQTDVSFNDRVAQLTAAFVQGGMSIQAAIPKAIEQALLEGFKPDNNDPDPNKPRQVVQEEQTQDAPKEDKELGINQGEQGANWVENQIATDKPKKDPCQVCNNEECTCDKNDKSGTGKPSFASFMAEEIAKLADDEEVTAETIQRIKDSYNNLDKPVQKEVQYANGFTKEYVTERKKAFINKTSPLIEDRHKEVVKFFKSFKRIVMNRFGADLKSYGMHKARNSSDAEEIMDEKAYKELLQSYIAEIDKALEKALNEGYSDTLVNVQFDKAPSEAALKALKKYALMSATSVTDTTRGQLKTLLVDAFEEGKSVTEIGQMISDKFEEIEMGRAMTIARTETLTAVSIGQADKREQYKEMFPDAKLRKMWITSQDDRVRDEHAEMEGETVGVDEEFSNGLKYPRDPSGEAASVINCRCTLLDYVEGDEALLTAEDN